MVHNCIVVSTWNLPETDWMLVAELAHLAQESGNLACMVRVKTCCQTRILFTLNDAHQAVENCLLKGTEHAQLPHVHYLTSVFTKLPLPCGPGSALWQSVAVELNLRFRHHCQDTIHKLQFSLGLQRGEFLCQSHGASHSLPRSRVTARWHISWEA
jgi:hypothetical protein